MKISEVFKSWGEWLTSWWASPVNRNAVLDILDHAAVFADHAMPIVEAIDTELKPALRTGHFAFSMTIENFIRKHCGDADPTEVAVLATRLNAMPTPDMLVNVALFLLSRASPKNTGVSILRLAIELAYNVYKGSKDEAKVS